EVSSYLEQPRGKMCIVFTLNGQRHDGLDNSFIVNELGMKYLRKRMIIVVDLDGLSHQASAEIIQGSRSGLYKGAVFDEIRRKLNKLTTIALKSHPASDWSSLNDLAVLIEPQIPGLTHHITRNEGSAEVTLTFKEPEDFSIDEYPLEATMGVIAKFKEKNE